MRLKKHVRLLVIDPFANENFGHLLDDDLFWATYLPPKIGMFGIRSSLASIAQIKQMVKSSNGNTLDAKTILGYKLSKPPGRARLVLMGIFTRTSKYSDVLFQSFDEISTLIFMLLRPSLRVHLIVTNNLSLDRFERRPIYFPIIFKLIFTMAKTIFVHSQFEIDFISKKLMIDPAKIKAKPFHQFSVNWPNKPLTERLGYILFVGPTRNTRPLSPFLELIRADFNQKNKYVIAGISNSDLDNLKDIITQNNVEVINRFLSKDEYRKLIAEAKLIILTHNHYFEGRLSGTFCDAVASETPIVSSAIAPVTEYFKNFGALGILVDYNKKGWWNFILNEHLNIDMEYYSKAVETVKVFSKPDSIINVVLDTICSSD